METVPWSRISGALDTMLCTAMFSSHLPRSARLLIKGDRGIIETLDGDNNISKRVMMEPPVQKGMIASLVDKGQFGSIIILEQGTATRHIYEAVICIIPENKSPRSS